jgi:prevent-host-death family protein
MTMTKVRIAELKARLSEYLRRVRRGHTITVLDRETPVARMVPYTEHDALSVREPLGRRRLQRVPLPPPLKLKLDVVALLLEERQVDR